MRSAFALAMLLVACGGADAPVDRAAAERAVERWFAAVAGGDCATLIAMTEPAIDTRACGLIVEGFRERETRLLGIEKSIIDGRNANAVMVTTKVYFRNRYGDEHRWIMRAERKGETWRVHRP